MFFDGILQPTTAYTINGVIITLANAPVNVPPVTPASVFVVVTLDDFYRLGTVSYQAGALNTQELERVTRSELYHLNSSKLTKPSTTYPVYLYENKRLTVYPQTITSGITVDYIRKPLPPVWNFNEPVVSNNFAYTFNPATSFNFELHPAEQVELILKILLYAGVVVKSPEIVQIAAQQVAQENINQQR